MCSLAFSSLEAAVGKVPPIFPKLVHIATCRGAGVSCLGEDCSICEESFNDMGVVGHSERVAHTAQCVVAWKKESIEVVNKLAEMSNGYDKASADLATSGQKLEASAKAHAEALAAQGAELHAARLEARRLREASTTGGPVGTSAADRELASAKAEFNQLKQTREKERAAAADQVARLQAQLTAATLRQGQPSGSGGVLPPGAGSQQYPAVPLFSSVGSPGDDLAPRVKTAQQAALAAQGVHAFHPGGIGSLTLVEQNGFVPSLWPLRVLASISGAACNRW